MLGIADIVNKTENNSSCTFRCHCNRHRALLESTIPCLNKHVLYSIIISTCGIDLVGCLQHQFIRIGRMSALYWDTLWSDLQYWWCEHRSAQNMVFENCSTVLRLLFAEKSRRFSGPTYNMMMSTIYTLCIQYHRPNPLVFVHTGLVTVCTFDHIICC